MNKYVCNLTIGHDVVLEINANNIEEAHEKARRISLERLKHGEKLVGMNIRNKTVDTKEA